MGFKQKKSKHLIDKIDDIVSLGLKTGVIVQSHGPKFTFGETTVKGMEEFLATLREDEKLQKELLKLKLTNKKLSTLSILTKDLKQKMPLQENLLLNNSIIDLKMM